MSQIFFFVTQFGSYLVSGTMVPRMDYELGTSRPRGNTSSPASHPQYQVYIDHHHNHDHHHFIALKPATSQRVLHFLLFFFYFTQSTQHQLEHEGQHEQQQQQQRINSPGTRGSLSDTILVVLTVFHIFLCLGEVILFHTYICWLCCRTFIRVRIMQAHTIHDVHFAACTRLTSVLVLIIWLCTDFFVESVPYIEAEKLNAVHTQ